MTAPLWAIAAALLAHALETAAIARTITPTTLRLYRGCIAACVAAAVVEVLR